MWQNLFPTLYVVQPVMFTEALALRFYNVPQLPAGGEIVGYN